MLTIVAVVPLTVHTDVVSDEKTIGSPDDALAVKLTKGDPPQDWLLGAVKLIDCIPGATVMEKACVAGGLTVLDAVAVPLNGPAVVGVPPITPVVDESV